MSSPNSARTKDPKSITKIARQRSPKTLPIGSGVVSTKESKTPAEPQEEINADLPTFTTLKYTPRTRVGQWVAIRAAKPDLDNKEIAEEIGISYQYLRNCIYKASKEGWLKFESPLDRIEYQIIPKVVENLNLLLDARDKQTTIETAKGTIFKQYTESKGIIEAPTTILALKIEQPPSHDGEVSTLVIGGKIVGKPKGIED